MTQTRKEALIELRDKVREKDIPAFEIGSLAANVWKPESAYGLCTFMLDRKSTRLNSSHADYIH
jgi:hypothetical protein